MNFLDMVWLFALCLGAATLALGLVAYVERRADRGRSGLFAESGAGTVFLFDGDVLLDASAGGRALLSASRVEGAAWHRFMAYAAPRFPGLEAEIDRLADLGRFSMTSPGADGLTLLAEWRGGLRRVTLLEPHLETSGRLVDSLAQKAQDDELATLRQITDASPHPVWRETDDGTVTWANGAYVALVMRMATSGAGVGWPLPRLLDLRDARRMPLHQPDTGEPLWFDCTAVETPGGRIVFALPADAAVSAENALGSFIHTLSKTFADLPIGLAVFDRQRKLQLFNPAMTDLSGLPVDFLSARPTLFAFLDAMRERGMIPEPKDYKSWRTHIAALEGAAASGQFEETWALASGLTYRILGRPQPEGALALFFQDISDEITRARRMRADLEIGQSVIDTTDEAIAVFSSAGQLVMSNMAYARLWAHDPSETLADHPIAALAKIWRASCAPTHFWDLAEGYVATSGRREPWVSQARLNDGRGLRCRLAPLAGGATLLGFAAEPALERHPETGLAWPAEGDAPPRRVVAVKG